MLLTRSITGMALLLTLSSAAATAQSKPSAAQHKSTTHRRTETPAVLFNPAKVTYDAGQLTVVANNNSLADTLSEIKELTKAKIEGVQLPAEDKLTGEFGPDTPRAVLSQLLSTSHYNFILISAPGKPGSIQKIVLSEASPDTPETPVQQAVNQQPPAEAQKPEQSTRGDQEKAQPADPDKAPIADPGDGPGGNGNVPPPNLSDPKAGGNEAAPAPQEAVPAPRDEAQNADDTPAVPVTVKICGVTYDASQLANIKVPEHCDKPAQQQTPAKPSK